MSKKTIAPVAINALKEALTNIYWYKNELRSFLTNTISNPRILVRLNWEDYKRNIVTNLIDFLATDEDNYRNDLLSLMNEVIRINDFSHLKRLDKGLEKAKKAEESVKALKKLVEGHFDLIEEQRKGEERRRKAQLNQ